MALTENQQREYQVSLNESIAALRKIAMHVGLIAPCASLAITKAEQERRIEEYGVAPAMWCVAVLLSDSATKQQKAACGLLLECFVPDWREIVGPSVYGEILDRDDKLVHRWRREVLARDGFACVRCEAKENLHAHHIVRWADCPELRDEVSNGMTLCKSCHEAEHAKTR